MDLSQFTPNPRPADVSNGMEVKALSHDPDDARASDAPLVRDAMRGSRDAFDQLVRRYQRQAVAVSYRLLGNIDDAQEVTQDAFIKAYDSLKGLQKPEAFVGWLMRIVSNLSLNYRRSRKVRQQMTLDDGLGPTEKRQLDAAGSSQWAALSGNPLDRLQSAEMGEKLKLALEQLPEKQRLAITMFTLDEMPQKDIAVVLDCSVEAVKWHVFQGRKKLKEFLEDAL